MVQKQFSSALSAHFAKQPLDRALVENTLPAIDEKFKEPLMDLLMSGGYTLEEIKDQQVQEKIASWNREIEKVQLKTVAATIDLVDEFTQTPQNFFQNRHVAV